MRRLILLRKEKSISQKQLAVLINSHRAHIARLETGEVQPTLRTLKRYVGRLGYQIKLNFTPIEKR